jgi:uncharacterized protein
MEDFQVFVKPVGARCNLSCSYCYYSDKKEITGEQPDCISDELLEQLIIRHIEASQGPEVFFSWHGGEPTLAGLEFFKKIVALQQKHLPQNKMIINGIQTNGTLLNDQWGMFLKRENFLVGISMDGPQKFYSVNRFTRRGRSAFDEALRGYHLLKKFEIPCEILCVVNSSNTDYPLDIYSYFKELNASFITFIPLVEKNIKGKISERSVDPESYGKFLCVIFDEWKNHDIGQIKIQIIEEAMRTAFGLEHTLCIFKKICGRVPVIEHNGDFYSCDHFVDQQHRIGNIHEQSIQMLLENPSQKAFGRLKYETLPQFCLNCEVLSMCNGACPKDRFIKTPDGDPFLNYLCKGYKLFFNHIRPFADTVAQAWKPK